MSKTTAGNGAPVSGIVYDYDDRLYDNPLSIGAYGFGPLLKLRGTPANQTIRLTWDVSAAFPFTSTWRIDYYSQTVTTPISITGIVSSTRAYTLTSLTNYTGYTVTLSALLNCTPFLTDPVRVMPTNRFVYLPIVVRSAVTR